MAQHHPDNRLYPTEAVVLMLPLCCVVFNLFRGECLELQVMGGFGVLNQGKTFLAVLRNLI